MDLHGIRNTSDGGIVIWQTASPKKSNTGSYQTYYTEPHNTTDDILARVVALAVVYWNFAKISPSEIITIFLPVFNFLLYPLGCIHISQVSPHPSSNGSGQSWR